MGRCIGSKNIKKSKNENCCELNNNNEIVLNNNAKIPIKNIIFNDNILDSSFLIPNLENTEFQTTEKSSNINVSKINEWINSQTKTRIIDFLKPEALFDMSKITENTSILHMFFSKAFLNYLLIETNKSIDVNEASKNNYCSLISIVEIKKFIGITILMGIIKLPNIKLYWEDSTYGNAFIGGHFRLTKYIESESSVNYKNVQEKTTHIINSLKKLFKAIIIPGKIYVLMRQ